MRLRFAAVVACGLLASSGCGWDTYMQPETCEQDSDCWGDTGGVECCGVNGQATYGTCPVPGESCVEAQCACSEDAGPGECSVFPDSGVADTCMTGGGREGEG
jgi:hypothetical protein